MIDEGTREGDKNLIAKDDLVIYMLKWVLTLYI
jgi:hypothetical protein